MYATLPTVTTTQMPDLLGLQNAEFEVPSEQKLQKSLANPHSPGSMQLGAIRQITQARIRWALAELVALNFEKVSAWLDEAAKDSPTAAIDRLIELTKFVTAQQKSMTVEAPPPGDVNYGQYSLAQLQQMVLNPTMGEGVVSNQ